jgi:hypothetical protein
MKRMHIRPYAVSLVLGALVALGGSSAWAQGLQSIQPAQGQLQRAPIAWTPTSTQGAIRRFVLGPMGRVRAVVLDNGKLIELGRHGDRAAQSLGVGARVQAQGYASAQAPDTLVGATVRDASGAVLVQPHPRMIERLTQQPGAQGGWGPHGRGGMRGHGRFGRGQPDARGPQDRGALLRQRIAQLPQRSASGTVQTLLVGPRGHIRGVLLQDGTSVTFDRALSRAATQQRLTVGQTLSVQGRGDQYARGVALFAERVTFANGQTVAAQ